MTEEWTEANPLEGLALCNVVPWWALLTVWVLAGAEKITTVQEAADLISQQIK